MKKIYQFLGAFLLICSLGIISSHAQQKITGTVVSATDGQAQPGTSVAVKGSTLGTSADGSGKYSISASANSVLVFSFVGFKSQEILVGSKSVIDVSLVPDDKSLDEVVVVAYGSQKKSSVTGSVATVKAKDLTVAPIASVTNAMVGRLPGLVAKQTTGQPGSDAAAISIRGFGNALVIVDGVESSFNNYDSNQIESITVLKDGAAAIYGARAGNGVILVTTKRGNSGKPVISLNSNYSLQGVTNMMTPTKDYQLAEIQREIHLQGGNPIATAPWTLEQIKTMKDGTGGPNFPYANTDWFDLTFREWAPQQQHNLSVRGGSEKVKYYGFIGYTDQETMIKTSGGGFQRYNIQANIDASITKNLSMRLDLSGGVENRKFPIRGLENGGSAWQDLYTTRPFFPAFLPDKSLLADGGSDVGSVYAATNIDISGYTASEQKDLKATLVLDYNFPFLKGLSARLLANYRDFNTLSKRFQKPMSFYTYDSNADRYNLVRQFFSRAELSQTFQTEPTITQNYSINYDNRFGDHNISVIGLYESIDYSTANFNAARRDFLTPTIEQLFVGGPATATNGGFATQMGRQSYVGRFNYGFRDKYLLEAIIRADASAKFAPEGRWGYFPSVSAGWVVSKESFMQNINAIDNLKLRTSYGQTGNDAIGNFQYLSGYNLADFYAFNAISQQGISQRGISNPALTWERISIANAGLDFSFLNRKIYGEFDAFYRERKGILGTRAAVLPSTFGASLPLENLNSLNDRGFEFLIGTTGKVGDLQFDISGNISWSRSKWMDVEEPVYTDEDLRRLNQRSGQWVDRVFGFKTDGLFKNQEEINALPYDQDLRGNITLRPGDVKFLDVNGDKRIDFRDQVELGQGSIPHWMFGSNINLTYKNFDLSALIQGAFGYSSNMNLRGRYGGIFSERLWELRWNEDNPDPNALVPRLGGAGGNRNTSDYYIKDAAYARLKTFAIGYTLPKKVLSKAGFEQARVFVSGTNMFTWNKLAIYDLDPETPVNTEVASLQAEPLRVYPQQRVLSFGVNLSF